MPEKESAPAAETTGKPKARRVSSKPQRKPETKAPEAEETLEAPSQDGDAGKAGQKRNNRRKRGKGKPSGQSPDQTRPAEAGAAAPADEPALAPGPPKEDGKPAAREDRKSQDQPRRKLDPEKVAKNAWKIFLAEVSEEGVALIGDSNARELARRCFRLSEIFLEEEQRRG